MRRLLKFLGRWSIRIAGVLLGILLLFHTISYGVYLVKSPVPRLGSYEAQRELANERYQWVYGYRHPLSPMPYQLLWLGSKSALKAHERLMEWHPEESRGDVNVMERVADLYNWIGQGEKGLEYYQRQLEIFKEKHFLKDFKTASKPLTHYQFLTRIRWDIAAQYVELDRYEEAVDEYQRLLDETAGMPEGQTWVDRYEIIGRTLEKQAEVYYKHLKQYEKAIANYERVQELFPKPLAISRSKIYIGDVYLAKGDKTKAVETYQKVAEEFRNVQGTERPWARLKKIKEKPDGPYWWLK